MERQVMGANMSPQSTCFCKKLHRSHLSHYNMRLPKKFCDEHLPSHNNTIILVDESEREYNVRYGVKENTFVGGWRDFVIAHGLLEGDTLVFQLIDSCKFKVHIIRAGRSIENLFLNNKPVDLGRLEDLIEENACIGNTATQKKHPVSRAVDSHQMQDRMLCRIKKRVHEEVVPKETMKHVKLAFSPQYNSFCKIMHRSHLSRFNMRLPKKFCDEHLASHENTIILVDESEREYNVRYWVKENKLMGGWRDFVVAHGLLEGDTLVFQLIDPCKFKVHITRASRSIKNEFQNNMPLDFGTSKKMCIGNTATQKKYPVSRSVDSCQNDRMLCPIKEMVHEGMVPEEKVKQVYVRRKHRSTKTNGAYDIHSAAPLGFGNSESALNFMGFEDFKIHVNGGETLDSEISTNIRMKYYQLCCVQKTFLHGRVTKDLDTKLVVEMILEVVSIADFTKSTSISTPVQNLERMDKTLKYFEDVGMTVGSLRAKIRKLIKILSEHHSVAESTRVKLEEIESERKAFMEKKTKIDELIENAIAHGELIGHLEKNVDGSKEKMEELSIMLKEVAA